MFTAEPSTGIVCTETTTSSYTCLLLEGAGGTLNCATVGNPPPTLTINSDVSEQISANNITGLVTFSSATNAENRAMVDCTATSGEVTVSRSFTVYVGREYLMSIKIKPIKIANVKVQTINVMLLHVVFDCLCGMKKCEVFGRESSYGACSVLINCVLCFSVGSLAQPTDVTATISDSILTVSWTYSDPDNNIPLVLFSYTIQAATSGSTVVRDGTAGPSERSLTVDVSELEENTRYNVELRAENQLGSTAAASQFTTPSEYNTSS